MKTQITERGIIMRKTIAVILAILQIAILLSAASANETAAGMWYLRTLITDGYEIDVATLGVEGSLSLNDDGTAILSQSEKVYEGTWRTESGRIIITMGNSDAEAIIDGGRLVLSGGDSTVMKFDREKPGEQSLAEPNPDAQPADFNGEWTCISLVMKKDQTIIVIPIAVATEQGINIPNIVMENGNMKFLGEDVSSVPGAQPEYAMRFEGGKYTNLEENADSEISSYAELHILQDGTLLYSLIHKGEASIGMCFEKAMKSSD